MPCARQLRRRSSDGAEQAGAPGEAAAFGAGRVAPQIGFVGGDLALELVHRAVAVLIGLLEAALDARTAGALDADGAREEPVHLGEERRHEGRFRGAGDRAVGQPLQGEPEAGEGAGMGEGAQLRWAGRAARRGRLGLGQLKGGMGTQARQGEIAQQDAAHGVGDLGGAGARKGQFGFGDIRRFVVVIVHRHRSGQAAKIGRIGRDRNIIVRIKSARGRRASGETRIRYIMEIIGMGKRSHSGVSSGPLRPGLAAASSRAQMCSIALGPDRRSCRCASSPYRGACAAHRRTAR